MLDGSVHFNYKLGIEKKEDAWALVHLRSVTLDNFHECISLEVNESQKGLVASNVKSLAEAYVNPNLFPLVIYDAAVTGYEKPQLPMVGFTMYEITAGVGFILRLMIDRKYQRKGYGRAAMLKVIQVSSCTRKLS